MSKPFKIGIDVDKSSLGEVMEVLDSIPGVLSIHLALGAAKQQQQLPSPAPGYDPVQKRIETKRRIASGRMPPMRQVFLQALVNGPLHYQKIGSLLAKKGFSFASVHSAVTKMSSEKLIERVSPGTYRLTAKGRALLNSDNVNRTYTRRAINNKKGVRALVLDFLSNGSQSVDAVRDVIKGAGFAHSSLYNTVHRMREEDLIRRNGELYEITAKGRKEMGAEAEAFESVEDQPEVTMMPLRSSLMNDMEHGE